MSDAGDIFIVKGFGRQRVFQPVNRCIYCFESNVPLGDEHIIPQALGGNMILPNASCRVCERIIGSSLEGSLTNKTVGMFAATRLRAGFKSRRPKERPKSLPHTITGLDGQKRIINIPANKVPRRWANYITLGSPGIIMGRSRYEPWPATFQWQVSQEDLADILQPGESITFDGEHFEMRDLARFLAKIGHAAAVAKYGLDAFEPWLPNFILGKDDCTFHNLVAWFPNSSQDKLGDHKVALGTWEEDGIRIGA
ncbi:MAG TPA: HNH endonuclease, partial [Roseiarcus sp.]